MRTIIITSCICFVAVFAVYFIRINKNSSESNIASKSNIGKDVVLEKEKTTSKPEEVVNSTPTIPEVKETVVDIPVISTPQKAVDNRTTISTSKTQPTLNEIAQKFNNCSYVKRMSEDMGSKFKMFATAKGNTSISIKYDYVEKDVQKQTINQFNLSNNILSIELSKNVTTANEFGILLVSSIELQWLIDSVGQIYGYADGEGAKAVNEISEPTLEKNGWEVIYTKNSVICKTDISKKTVFKKL